MAFLEVVVKNFTENLSSKMANGSLKKGEDRRAGHIISSGLKKASPMGAPGSELISCVI
jgi:hypothetical protein